MPTTELIRATEVSRRSDVLSAIRHRLTGRLGIVVAAATVVVAGLAFKWSWLVAVGVAPLLVTALPCVAMCALGLCMHRMTGRARPGDDVSLKSGEDTDGLPTAPTNPKGNA